MRAIIIMVFKISAQDPFQTANDEQVARRSLIATGYWESIILFDPNTISAVLARGLRFWIPGSVGPETTKNYRNWLLEEA